MRVAAAELRRRRAGTVQRSAGAGVGARGQRAEGQSAECRQSAVQRQTRDGRRETRQSRSTGLLCGCGRRRVGEGEDGRVAGRGRGEAGRAHQLSPTRRRLRGINTGTGQLRSGAWYHGSRPKAPRGKSNGRGRGRGRERSEKEREKETGVSAVGAGEGGARVDVVVAAEGESSSKQQAAPAAPAAGDAGALGINHSSPPDPRAPVRP